MMKFFWAFLLILFGAGTGYGITLNGIYFGTCEREIGTIVHVDEKEIQLLTLPGDIKTISRFDIVYLAEYPLGNIPIQQVNNADATGVIRINTLSKFEPIELVRGWPINFSNRSILFLTTDGDELVVSRSHIYSIDQLKDLKRVELKNAKQVEYQFRYPALFKYCQDQEDDANESKTANEVFPQQLIGNPLLIKSQLDQLMDGYKGIEDYDRNEKFYAVPNIYTNDTQIGLWYNIHSRHGSTGSRTNNLIPFIINDYSGGPFGFQRRIITGSYLVPYSVHEEPQTLFSYALKADYFHFSVMFDPSLILLGPNYMPKVDDLKTHDDRMFETFHLAAGFDLGGFAVEAAIPVYLFGIRNEQYYASGGATGTRIHLSYQNQFFNAGLYYGRGEVSKDAVEDTDDNGQAVSTNETTGTNAADWNRLTMGRFNLSLDYLDDFRPYYSLIYKYLKYHRMPDALNFGEFEYENTMLTNFLAMDYKLPNDIVLTVYLSYEMNDMIYDSQENGPGAAKTNYMKGGGAIRLVF